MVTDSILDLVLYFIKDLIGEEQESEESSENESSKIDSSEVSKSNQIQSLKRKPLNSKAMPCILIFDHASIMDEESWTLVLRVFS
jgi:hypothetical protein